MGVRILAFEPDESDFRLLESALSAPGLDAQLQQVKTREEFLAALKNRLPEVVLVDYGRTEGEGMQALLWSQNVSDGGGRIPVILVTEPRGDAAAVRALKAGASDYVLKSDLGRLPDAVRSALREREEASKQARSAHELRFAAEQIRENQKLVTIGRLSGMITHEINNPLAAIANLLYLLRHEGSLSADALSYLRMAEKEMNRVVQISRQTLNFYREASSPERQKPQDLVDEVLTLYRRSLMEKNIKVRRRYDFAGTIMLYPGEMRQVISNMVINAIEAMQPGGTLTVHVYETRKWNQSSVSGVRIVIADTGNGIPADKLRQIGEPFFTTKGERGTGLGLWVSQGIIHKYGGDLQVSSSTSPNHHGTVFSIFLPKDMRTRTHSGGPVRLRRSSYEAKGSGGTHAINA